MAKAKKSAGVLLYRLKEPGFEVLLVHPGGPFWAKKDEHAWSIPKGEVGEQEDPLATARREFTEETGGTFDGVPLPLLPLKQPSGKTIYAFAVRGDFDPARLRSNTFPLEWPPKSGTVRDFPEVDRAGWFGPEEARRKLVKGQVGFVEQLAALLVSSSERGSLAGALAAAPAATTLLGRRPLPGGRCEVWLYSLDEGRLELLAQAVREGAEVTALEAEAERRGVRLVAGIDASLAVAAGDDAIEVWSSAGVVARARRGHDLEVVGRATVPLAAIAKVRTFLDGRGFAGVVLGLASGESVTVAEDYVSAFDDPTHTGNEVAFERAWSSHLAWHLAQWLGVPLEDD